MAAPVEHASSSPIVLSLAPMVTIVLPLRAGGAVGGWWGAARAGVPGWSPATGRCVYAAEFGQKRPPKGETELAARLEILAAAQMSQTPIATFELPVLPPARGAELTEPAVGAA